MNDGARNAGRVHSDAVVTVEGFAELAGSTAFNRRLGQRRAEAIRDYLTANGGLAASQVRAVSYGEDQNRQVRAGAMCAEGRDIAISTPCRFTPRLVRFPVKH